MTDPGFSATTSNTDKKSLFGRHGHTPAEIGLKERFNRGRR
jgi:hypothetical protein